MAEFGAHLTATSDVTPSIFELLASEGLSNGLRAGFKYFIKVLVDHSPGQYRRLFQFQEELYAGIDLLIQWIHLNRFGASFSENFYSLRRVAVKKGNRQLKLKNKELYLSLFFLVGFPYLRNKFLTWYSDLKHRRNSVSSSSTPEELLESLCLKFYPGLHLVFHLTTLAHHLSYAVGRSRVHSPLLKLARCQLITLSETDLQNLNQMNQSTYNRVLDLAVQALRQAVTMGAFTLQFLEWWYAQDTVPNLGALPIPTPPNVFQSLKVGHCPLCRHKFSNATLLSTSGIVFCYRCIHEQLSQSPVCPVTRYPSSHAQLIKLYLPEE